MKNNLVKNTVLLSIGTILNKGLVFAMIPLFSRWLSTEEYGTFDLVCTYITMLIPVLSLSSGDGMFRFGVEERGIKQKKYITAGFSIYLVGILFLGLALFCVNWIIDKPILLPFYVLLVCETFNNYLQYYLRSIKKLNVYSFTAIVSTVVTFASVTCLVKVLGLGINGIIYGYAIGFLVSNATVVLMTNFFKHISFRFSNREIKSIIRYSIPLIPNNISWWIVNASDRTIISMFLGPVANGVYAIAYKIPNFCTSVFSVFGIAWQETAIDVVKLKDRKEYYTRVFNRMFNLITTLCLILLATNFIFFEFIFDHRYYDGGLYTPILITSIIFSTISQFYGGIQISLKQPGKNGLSTIIGALVNVIVHLWLIQYIGLYAAAISTLISSAVIAMVRARMINNQSKLVGFSKNNIILIVIYMYFLVMSYSCRDVSIFIKLANLILSVIIFFVYNKEYIRKIINKIIKRKVS